MKIYEAYTNDGDFYNPIDKIGTFNSLERAKEKLNEIIYGNSYYLDVFINVLELRDEEFELIEVWERNALADNSFWEKGNA